MRSILVAVKLRITYLRGCLKKHISTSFVERHNLSVWMTNRRYTRLTNAFSKKIENRAASVALGYFAYNFIKIHRTLRMSPAMAAGVTGMLWEVVDLVKAGTHTSGGRKERRKHSIIWGGEPPQ